MEINYFDRLQILIKMNFGSSAVTCPDIGHSAVDHGRWRLIYGMQNKYEALMMLTCDPGYFYKGQRVIRCLANGTWDYPEPRPSCESECHIKTCFEYFQIMILFRISGLWDG